MFYCHDEGDDGVGREVLLVDGQGVLCSDNSSVFLRVQEVKNNRGLHYRT